MNKEMNFDTNSRTASTSSRATPSFGKSDVVCVDPSARITEVVNLMKENQVGDVVVVDSMNGAKKPIGMITDRDIALQCFDRDNFRDLTVQDCMSPGGIVTCPENADVFEMIRAMKDSGVGRLPLVNAEGTITKIVTARNLLQFLSDSLHDLVGISHAQRSNEQLAPTTH